MMKPARLLAAMLTLLISGCTAIYGLGGERYAITEDGAGVVRVRNLRTGEVIEESKGGPGPRAKLIEAEGTKIIDEATDGDSIIGGGGPGGGDAD